MALINSFQGHSNSIYRIKQLPNSYVATASGDNTSKIWNPLNGNWSLIQTFIGHNNSVICLEYVNSNTIATGSSDGTVKIWSISTGLTNLTINANTPMVRALKLLTNGYYLACGLLTPSLNISIYNINNGSLVATLVGHTSNLNDLELISAYNLLASSDTDLTIRIWNLTTYSLVFCLSGTYTGTGYPFALRLLPNNILACGAWDQTIKLFNITNGLLTLKTTLSGHTASIYYGLDLFSDGQTLASGAYDQLVKLWNYNTGQLLNTVNAGIQIRALAVFNATTCK